MSSAPSTEPDLNRTLSDEATETISPQQTEHLGELFDRVHNLLGIHAEEPAKSFQPSIPRDLRESGLTAAEVERLILKMLFATGQRNGREICAQIKLPYSIVDVLLKQLKQDQLVELKNTAVMGDYEFDITEAGRERARRFSEECTYFGAAPVPIRDYLAAMEQQSVAKQQVSEQDIRNSFSDLILNPHMLDRLGPAINSGRGMFLFGEPGNGKTSIAERITACFGATIWIPRALSVHGEIIRLYDPGVHVEVERTQSNGLLDEQDTDHRWIQIRRPTVIAGGELTMEQLELIQNQETKVCEAPLQLKSNCGTLIIDDFGRQRMPIADLLNRWIVPLEKRFDYLNMPSGKKIQVPFDQLIVFSTNLEPRELVDGAFLRRIPYKIEVMDPTEEEFHEICKLVAPTVGCEYDKAAITYLLEHHYRSHNRPLRACEPRDLLLQVRNFCAYKRQPKVLTKAALDMAVENYFSIL
ncbi:MAG: AAA family ATPase [Planctomycetaceae bacterium]